MAKHNKKAKRRVDDDRGEQQLYGVWDFGGTFEEGLVYSGYCYADQTLAERHAAVVYAGEVRPMGSVHLRLPDWILLREQYEKR